MRDESQLSFNQRDYVFSTRKTLGKSIKGNGDRTSDLKCRPKMFQEILGEKDRREVLVKGKGEGVGSGVRMSEGLSRGCKVRDLVAGTVRETERDREEAERKKRIKEKFSSSS